MNSISIGIISIIVFVFFVFAYKRLTNCFVNFPVYLYFAMFPWKMRAIGIPWLDDAVLKGLLVLGFLLLIRQCQHKFRVNRFELLFFITVVIESIMQIALADASFSLLLSGIINLGFVIAFSLFANNALYTQESIIAIHKVFICNGFLLSILACFEAASIKAIRSSVSLTNPNYLGYYLCVCFTMKLYEIRKSTKRSFGDCIMAIVLAVGILTTGSYSSIAGAILIAALFWSKNAISVNTAFIGLTVLLLVVFCGVALVVSGAYEHYSIFNLLLEKKDPIRIFVWQRAFEVWQSHPIFGVGYNTFFVSLEGISREMITHNDYIRLLVETGIVGFLIILFYLYNSIKRSIQLKDDQRRIVFALLFSTMLFSVVHNNMNSIIFWFCISYVQYALRIEKTKT